MLILNWAQDMLTGNVSGILGKILRTIFLWLDSVIYGVIGWLYKLFTLLSEVRLFENDQMRQLQSRIYIVIGVISLFLVSYSLLNAIINPDNATKGKNNSVTGIVKNIILAVIGIAIVPTCFDYAYEFQRRVLCSNVITNLFLVEDPEEDTMIKDFGTEMSLTLFQSFYYAQQLSSDGLTYEPIVYDSSEASDWKTVASAITDDDNKTNFAEAIENIKSGKSSIFEALGNFDKAFENHQLGYFLIISTIAGAYCAYVLLGFVIDISIRAVKLSYLQIIAPLPIFTLVIPNQKKVFDNWLKKTTACFMEVFVRVIAITFAAFAVKYLPLWIFSWGGIGSGMSQLCGETVTKGLIVFARAAFIIGIFGFLKQAPKFISDLLPGFDSKGFKLGFGNAFAEAGGFRALGAAGGVATAAARNIGAGAKNVKNEWDKPLGKYGNTGKFMRTAGAVFGTAESGVAGAASGGVRSFIKGKDAKKWSDSVKFAGEGADAAMEAKLKRDEYREKHRKDTPLVGGILGTTAGHVTDAIDSIGDWINAPEATYKYAKAQHDKLSAVSSKEQAIKDFAKDQRSKEKNKALFKNKDGKSLASLEYEVLQAEKDLDNALKTRASLQNEVGDDSYDPVNIEMKRKAADNAVAAARREVQQAQNGADFSKAQQHLNEVLAEQSLAYAMQPDFSKTVAGVKARQEQAQKLADAANKALTDAKQNQLDAERYIDKMIENGASEYYGALDEDDKTKFDNLTKDYKSAVRDAKSLAGNNENITRYLNGEVDDQDINAKAVAKLFKSIDNELVGKINEYGDAIRKKSDKK